MSGSDNEKLLSVLQRVQRIFSSKQAAFRQFGEDLAGALAELKSAGVETGRGENSWTFTVIGQQCRFEADIQWADSTGPFPVEYQVFEKNNRGELGWQMQQRFFLNTDGIASADDKFKVNECLDTKQLLLIKRLLMLVLVNCDIKGASLPRGEPGQEGG